MTDRCEELALKLVDVALIQGTKKSNRVKAVATALRKFEREILLDKNRESVEGQCLEHNICLEERERILKKLEPHVKWASWHVSQDELSHTITAEEMVSWMILKCLVKGEDNAQT